jgi:hypothetical protein
VSVAFPLAAGPGGRYLVDASGVPFRIHGESTWHIVVNLSQADWRTYLDDRQAKGITAVLVVLLSSVPYIPGSSAPWLVSLGGSGAGTAALPFTLNKSGGTWDGDPTFANHDAAFSSPNDAYFAQYLAFCQDAASRGMVVLVAPLYTGFNLGATDGWWQTLTNSANTQAVHNTFGQYLANGHGTFGGFKGQGNIIWVLAGDTMPTNGSEGALRIKNLVQGMQSAGDAHPITQHWQHDFLADDQTDLASFLTIRAIYTHGAYPTSASTAAMARTTYAVSPAKPTFLIETCYWGEHGATRSDARLYGWHAALQTIGGYLKGFGPQYIFATSADGTTNAVGGGGSTAWIASTAYALNKYASHSGNWYRCITAGTSASSGGPTGTGASISDGTVTWTFVAAKSATIGGYANLLSEPSLLDDQVMGALLASIDWWRLVPSGLDAMGTIVTAGGGTAPVFTDQGSASGGTDYVASAATARGDFLVAYVPHAHSGSFTVDMTKCGKNASAYWVDPTNGARQYIASLANTGTHAFTVPGANAGGDSDWVLHVRSSAAPLLSWIG